MCIKNNLLRKQKIAKIILAKCDERKKAGYDSLTDSDIMDIFDECELQGISVTRKELKSMGIN